MTRLGFAPDILAPGDLNTMGRLEAPPLSAAEEVAVFDRHLEPRIRRVSATATGPEYHGGEGQALDDLMASRGFEVVIRSARVIGYCGVGAYADVWARTAAGTPDRPSGTASGQASLRGAFAGYSNNVSTRCA